MQAILRIRSLGWWEILEMADHMSALSISGAKSSNLHASLLDLSSAQYYSAHLHIHSKAHLHTIPLCVTLIPKHISPLPVKINHQTRVFQANEMAILILKFGVGAIMKSLKKILE